MIRKMTKTLGALLVLLMVASANAADVAYMRGASSPWGSNSNEAAMDAAFGAGNWDDLRMADGVGPFLPGSGYRFVFLEGSDNTANELNAYLQANLSTLEAFVSGGGHLIINSAPNQGGNIDLGFGGVTLTYPGVESANVEAADPAHPVFTTPINVATSYLGSAYAHAVVGPGLSPIINSVTLPGSVVLGELSYGEGIVLFGGMTTTNYHFSSDADNLRANIITYAAEGAVALPPAPAQARPIPTTSPLALMLLAVMLLVAARTIRDFI